MAHPRIHPLGDSALVIDSPAPATLSCQTRIWHVAEQARAWQFVVDIVPGMNNLTVIFDPLQADVLALAKQLEQAWEESAKAVKSSKSPSHVGRVIEVPVHYGGVGGPDLGLLAEHTRMRPEDVAALHAEGDYTVYFLGFQPGFAYLGGLVPALHMPRRANPRLAVPAGSVAIGGEQTGIYPSVTPGGWQLIGQTELHLFDPQRTPPSLMQPGDRVRFTVASVTP